MKINAKIWAILGILVGSAVVGAGITTYFLSRGENSLSSKQVNLKEISITKTGDPNQTFDFRQLDKIKLIKPDALSEEQFEKAAEEYNSIPADANDKVVEKRVGTGDSAIYYREYDDPYTGIKFRDFSYYTDPKTKKHRYFLGENGLVLLAFEFRREVTFGPEVGILNSVNINNFNVIDKNSNGVYFPEFRQIHINAFSAIESGLDLYSKVKLMMGTLFHEYMHHWASIYAEVGDNKAPENRSFNLFTDTIRNPSRLENTPYTTKIRYYGTSTSRNSADGYWSSYFAYNMYKLLNYDTRNTYHDAAEAALYNDNIEGLLPNGRDHIIDKTSSIYDNYAFNHVSLNDIFTYANSAPSFYKTPNNIYPILADKFTKLGRLNFANYASFVSSNSGISPETIRYLFSLTELVPREWSKFALTAYYSPSDVIEYKENPGRRGQYWGLSWGGFYKNQPDGTGNFFPSSLDEDWSKVFLFNSSAVRNGKIGPYYINPANIVFPNTVRSLKGSAWEQLWEDTPHESKILDRSKEFYRVFLNTMGYGKTISQIIAKTPETGVGVENLTPRIDSSGQNEIKLVGYLPQDTKYSGLVFQNTSGSATPYQVAEFKFKTFFDFFKGKRLYLENELTNGQEFKSYITDKFVDFSKVDTNQTIKFWEDKNHDGKFTPNEIVDGNITLPTSRYTTTLSSTTKVNRSVGSYKWYTLVKTTDGVKILVNSFRQQM